MLNEIQRFMIEAYENWRVITCNNNPYPGVLFVDENGGHWKPLNRATENQNPIIELINLISEKPVRKRPDFSKGTLYVAGNLTDEFVAVIQKEININKIVYYSDEDYAGNMHDHLTILRVNKSLGELNSERKWWTHELYENAYEIVKDRKFPVCLPCYNRPELPAAQLLKIAEYTEDLNYDWYIFVRETQREMYEEATKQYKYLHIVDFPDEEINNAGAVRRHIQDYVHDVLKKPCCFEIDDDTEMLTYGYDGFKENGDPKTEYRAPRVNNKMGNSMEVNTARVFAMWQLAMEEAIARNDKIVISCGMPIAFSWKTEYCQQFESFQLSRGAMTQVVCFNVERLCKEGIYHKNNPDCGFDDIDFTIRCLDKGLDVCSFPFIIYKCEPLGQGAITGNLEQRFINNNNKLKELHSDKPGWVKFRMKRNLDQCCIYFPGVRKMQLERGFWKDDEYKFNIYESGELIGKEIN